MRLFSIIFVFGGLGSYARYALSSWALNQWGLTFPYGTLLVNLLGCLLIGIIAGLPSSALSLSLPLRVALMTGFLGGLTTFSSYEYESFMLLLKGDSVKALLNLSVSVFFGLLCVFAGYWISRLGSLLRS